jgi:uncharacterized protein with GYD domain
VYGCREGRGKADGANAAEECVAFALHAEHAWGMATYFMFGSYSKDALKGISPARTKKAEALIKKLGGSVRSMYGLLGDKDIVLIVDFPGVEELIKVSVGLARVTGISFSTVQAVPVETFDKLASEV